MEISKEEYINLKDNHPPYILCYHYWSENKKEGYKDLSLEEFRDLFSIFVKNYMNAPIASPEGEVKICTHDSVMAKVFGYYEQKFGL